MVVPPKTSYCSSLALNTVDPPPAGVDYSGVIAGRVRSPEMKIFLCRKIQRKLRKGVFDNIIVCHTLCKHQKINNKVTWRNKNRTNVIIKY